MFKSIEQEISLNKVESARFLGLVLKLLIGILLFISWTLFIGVDVAGAEEQDYYSIHLASFKKLQNANGFVNSLIKRGKYKEFFRTTLEGIVTFFTLPSGFEVMEAMSLSITIVLPVVRPFCRISTS